MKPSHTIRPVFDDPNLVSTAGLVPVLALAESAGLYDLLTRLSVPSPNAGAKSVAVIGGMLAGADSIDDLDLLRHGGMPRLFAGVRAPSTLGTFLRSFTHGHVQQLDAIGGDLLAGLTARVPGVIAGAQDLQGFACIDVDDTIREVHGYAKQAAAYGYSGVRGLNIQLATVCTPLAAPVIARARLRKGNTASAKGVGRLLAQAIGTARAAGVNGQILCRADSAYYGWAFVGTAIRKKTWFGVTARMTKTVTTAITSIDEAAWVAIKYPNAIWEEDERYVSRCLGHLGRFGSVGSGAGLDAAGRLVDPGLGRHDGRFRAPAGEPVGAVAPGGVQGGLAGAVLIAPAAVVDRGGRVEPDPGVPVMVVVVAGEVVHEGARVG